jgi:hypothetical protein
MLDIFAGWSALSCVFASVALISFLFAVLSLIGTEFGDVLDVDGDVDSDFDFANVSPFALATFGATFGLVGLICSVWLELGPITSIIIATIAGVIVGGLAQLLFIYVLSPSKSSHYSLHDDAVGREAQVTVTIPAEGQGHIAFYNVSGRVNLGARSATGEEIDVGEFVTIERIIGRSAVVRPLEIDEPS